MKWEEALQPIYLKVRGWIFPKNIPHSIQGLNEGCEFLMFFDKGDYSEHNTFSISELFAHIPMDVLSANCEVAEEIFKNIPSKEVYITEGIDPGSLKSQTVSLLGDRFQIHISMNFAR